MTYIFDPDKFPYPTIDNNLTDEEIDGLLEHFPAQLLYILSHRLKLNQLLFCAELVPPKPGTYLAALINRARWNLLNNLCHSCHRQFSSIIYKHTCITCDYNFCEECCEETGDQELSIIACKTCMNVERANS